MNIVTNLFWHIGLKLATHAILCEEHSMIQSGAVGRKGASQRFHNQGFGCENGRLCSDAGVDQEESIIPRLPTQPTCFTLAFALFYDRCHDVWVRNHCALYPAFIEKILDGDPTILSKFRQHTLPSDLVNPLFLRVLHIESIELIYCGWRWRSECGGYSVFRNILWLERTWAKNQLKEYPTPKPLTA